MNALNIACSTILAPAGLGESDLERVLGRLMGPSIDAGDVYFQARRSESWALEDGVVREGAHSLGQGAGIRANCGDKTGFAYSDDLVLPSLLEAAQSACAIGRSGREGSVAVPQRTAGHDLYRPLDPITTMTSAQKVDLLQQVDTEARRQDPRVRQVFVTLAASYDVVLVAAADGSLSADVRPLVRLSVRVIAEQDGRREQGGAGGGARAGYDFLLQEQRALDYAREAVRQALVNLESIPAPAGSMTVVLGPGWPGVLLHEAVGHGLEGDFNRKGTSAFAGRIGERVASPLCTVVDDGTLSGRRGSLNVDDEGTCTQRTVLIENGILHGYLQDRLNARLMGVPPTGNGRRESYAHLPLPRMTNTYMLAGQSDPREIIESVEHGLYAVNFGGGQVDITSGKFTFSANEAYLIEQGRVTHPVKGATLVGNGPDVLTRVSMVGDDMRLDNGVGTCGKEGQSVPVGVGQPTLKIDGLTVGGTAA